MIIDGILSFILSIPNALLDGLPSVDISTINNGMLFFDSIVGYIGYFIPVKELIPLMVIELSVIGFKIVWAIVLRVKSFIPTMGN